MILVRNSGCISTKYVIAYFTAIGYTDLFYLRTFESIATEHIICTDKLALGPNFYYSLANCLLRSDKDFEQKNCNFLPILAKIIPALLSNIVAMGTVNVPWN